MRRCNARLAVIDPIMAFLDISVLSGSDQSVRRVLAPLIELADKHRCTLLLHRHLNKQGGRRAVYRGLGSIAFVAASRCALLVARDPLVPGRCVLAQVRSSLAGPQPSLAYQITATDDGLPALNWLGASPCSADDLLAGTIGADRGRREQAALFLEQLLSAGPRRAQEIQDAAQKAGVCSRTLDRAKRDLGVRCQRTHEGCRPVSYWLLPAQELPYSPTGDPELDRLLADLDKPRPLVLPPEDDLESNPAADLDDADPDGWDR